MFSGLDTARTSNLALFQGPILLVQPVLAVVPWPSSCRFFFRGSGVVDISVGVSACTLGYRCVRGITRFFRGRYG